MFKITKNWYELLAEEFKKDYYLSLTKFLADEYSKYTVYPKPENVFNALNHVKFEAVRVVILGQDPYHGEGQAHGLCFSVEDTVALPPSLINIFKELKDDLGIPCVSHGNLSKWARQGVLLLNTSLTVRAGQANSHKGKGWENLTAVILEKLNLRNEPVVFLLWGANARELGKLVTNPNHVKLYAAHPSPLSAYNGWFGCKHFSKTNEILKTLGKPEIDWDLN